MKKAYFAGGCFWCIASVFDAIDGVTEVVSGFSGGDEADPTYDDVKAQKTGEPPPPVAEWPEWKALMEDFDYCGANFILLFP